LRQRESELAALQANLRAAQAENGQLKAQLARLKAENVALRAQAAELNRTLASLNATYVSQVSQLQARLEASTRIAWIGAIVGVSRWGGGLGRSPQEAAVREATAR
jgi:hypothetical protein